MRKMNMWKGIAAAMLSGAVLMTGCVSGKADAASAVESSAPGTVEASTGQEAVPPPKSQPPAAEGTSGSTAADWSVASACTGRYLRTKNGGNMVVLDRQGPVSFQSTEQEPRFADFNSGDKVQVKIEFIQETYPGQSEALDIRLLEKGSLEDVDADTLTVLTEMGWLEPERDEDWQVVLGGVLLRSTGREAKAGGGKPDGTLSSSVAVNQTPEVEGQSNFGFRDIAYIRLGENAAAVKLDGRYILFLADGTVEYEGDFYQEDQLSQETLDWLEYYNSLPEEIQRSISMVPADLIADNGAAGKRADETASGN
ncbi:MAG: YobA family protein [Clostridium sp.]|nr:YobA family protein [Clostridium sp.]